MIRSPARRQSRRRHRDPHRRLRLGCGESPEERASLERAMAGSEVAPDRGRRTQGHCDRAGTRPLCRSNRVLPSAEPVPRCSPPSPSRTRVERRGAPVVAVNRSCCRDPRDGPSRRRGRAWFSPPLPAVAALVVGGIAVTHFTNPLTILLVRRRTSSRSPSLPSTAAARRRCMWSDSLGEAAVTIAGIGQLPARLRLPALVHGRRDPAGWNLHRRQRSIVLAGSMHAG